MKKSPASSKQAETQMSRRNLVMRVYLYVFMGIGIVMTSFGVFGLGQNIYKSQLFAKYPLENYNESRCDYLEMPYPAMPVDARAEKEAQVSYEQSKQQAEKCRLSLEEERKVKKVTDFYNSLILLGIGSALFVGHLAVNLRTNNR